MPAEVICIRLREVFNPVHGVETARKASGHLQMLLLILAYRDLVCLVNDDVGCHEHRVGEQAGIDVIRLLAYLLLE